MDGWKTIVHGVCWASQLVARARGWRAAVKGPGLVAQGPGADLVLARLTGVTQASASWWFCISCAQGSVTGP